MFNIIHVTHEAVYKVGGIGTVLEGLINSRPYRDQTGRTVLVCPLFYPENTQRLGPGGVIEYSSLDHIYGGPYAPHFGRIEQDYNVRIIYGRRPLEDENSSRRTLCDVLLVDLRGINAQRVNHLKAILWERFNIPSDRYEHIWEFEQYVQLAGPAAAALEALGLATNDAPAIVFAHEFMGIPTALALQALHRDRYRTIFHAHEVAPVRRVVENIPGHDVMFYNALDAGLKESLDLDQVFGPQEDYFKHPLVRAAHHCDSLLAVGHHVQRELEFLAPEFQQAGIHLAYNGIPSGQISLHQRHAAKKRLRQYCQNLLGWQPNLIFTHVTRLAPSKAMWRDLDVLEALDEPLRQRNQTAVLLALSTELPRRPLNDILHMEREWDWPLAHREQHPDLTGGEANFYQRIQAFNTRARNVKVLFINQFGFDRERCGLRVPQNLEFLDIRRACDVEFGLSLYEPFGISPLEPLTYGGICLISTSCGCAGFVKHITGRKKPANVILANYIDGVRRPRTIKACLAIGADELRQIERKLAPQIAQQILDNLPSDNAAEQSLINSGYELAQQMSWDAVGERLVFPAIRRACARSRILNIA